MKTIYKLAEESPKEVTISTYWKRDERVSLLREGLPYNHKENLWNWFSDTYPDLNPEYYGIEKPKRNENY